MNFEEMEKILQEINENLRKKNQMYGDGNVDKMGKIGVLTRIEEKIERLKHMINNNLESQEEPMEDSWKDIAGFGVIGWMLQRNKWK